MHGALIAAFALLGCRYHLGSPRVDYGPPATLPLVRTSTDPERWFVPLETPKESTESDKKKEAVEQIFDKLENGEPSKDAAAPGGADKDKDKEAAKPKLDNQMARAVDLIKGIRIYRTMNHKGESNT